MNIETKPVALEYDDNGLLLMPHMKGETPAELPTLGDAVEAHTTPATPTAPWTN